MVKTRSASAASSIRSAAWPIFLDSMCRSRKRASASSMMPGIALGPARVGARQRLNDQREAVGEVIARSAVLARNDTEAVMLDLVQSLATRGSLSVLSEGTARRTRRAGAPAVSGRVWPPLSPRRWPRARITTSTSTTVRAHVSSSGRRPPHAVRSAGVAYLPICGFQEFHPVGRRKQLRLGCLVRAATSWFR
jgi:hypothetical protein